MRTLCTVLGLMLALITAARLLMETRPPKVYDGVIVDCCVDVDPYHPGQQMFGLMVTAPDSRDTLRAPITARQYYQVDTLHIGHGVRFMRNTTLTNVPFATIVP